MEHTTQRFLSPTETAMYSAKVYDRMGIFKYTISAKEMSSQYRYNATINSTYGSWSFDYRWEHLIQHTDRIQLYKWDTPVYIGYVTRITNHYDGVNQRLSIGCSGIIGLLQYIPYTDLSAHGNPSQLIKNCFDLIPGCDTSDIEQFTRNISIKTEDNINYLQLLKEVLQYTAWRGFFVDANLKIRFWPYHGHHILTYKRDCVGIEWDEDSTNYYNTITLHYDGGSLTQEDSEWVQHYGTHHRIFKDERVQLLATAEQRVASELQRAKIHKSCKITVNNDYPFDTIIPWDILSVRNTPHTIINRQVKQISYASNTAILTLNSHQSLEHFISHHNNV